MAGRAARLAAGTAAVFVSGASMANTTALAAARDHQLARAGWDVQADGLFGAPELTVVIGSTPIPRCSRRWAWWGWGGTGCAGSRPMIKGGCAPIASPTT